jgi:hypothetical protein
MNAAEFSQLLKFPSAEIQPVKPEWQELLSRHPYAASLYILQVLAQEKESAGYEEMLHRAAARTLSRSKLQFLVEGMPELEAEWRVLPPQEIIIEEKTADTEAKAEEIPLPEAEELPEPEAEPVAAPNEFGYSFVRLKAGKKAKVKEAEAPAEAVPDGKNKVKKNQQDAIIEKFLNEKPFLQPRLDFGDEGKVPDLASKSGKLKEEIVTENMAMIYIRQKKIPQAIATLRKLTLKIPEKSAYFASLIKNLESQNPS